MDWRNVTFDWNRARAFLVTAEEGSLSAAARALGMAQPTLGRQVAALEEELGVALFERTGRGLRLTPTGLDLVEHVRAMGEAAGRVSLAASGHSETLEGPICITASEVYSAFLLPPVIRRLRREHPGIEIEIVASNEMRDLRRREADIAIRNARPDQPDLIGRRLPDDTGTFYAAPSYLEALGNPGTPQDFGAADFLVFDRREAFLTLLSSMGFELGPRNFPIVAASHLVHLELVRQGCGIGVFPNAIGDGDPGLCRILPDLPPIGIPVWLVAHREVRSNRRVRLVFDMLTEALGGDG